MALTLSTPKQDKPLFGFLRLKPAATPEQCPAALSADGEDTAPVFRSTRSRSLEVAA